MKLKRILELIPFFGNYANNNIFSYRVSRQHSGVKLEFQEIDSIVKSVFPKAKCYRQLDKSAVTINREELYELLKYTKVTNQQYIEDDHDCDDYAFALKGFFSQRGLSKTCLGVMVSKNHAYNFFIDDKKDLWIIEPQNGYKTFLAKDYKQHTEQDYKSIEYIV